MSHNPYNCVWLSSISCSLSLWCCTYYLYPSYLSVFLGIWEHNSTFPGMSCMLCGWCCDTFFFLINICLCHHFKNRIQTNILNFSTCSLVWVIHKMDTYSFQQISKKSISGHLTKQLMFWVVFRGKHYNTLFFCVKCVPIL